MINRSMVRTHVVQTLFAHYQSEGNTTLHARKELLKSFSCTYNLYLLLLDFVNELTNYAEEQLNERIKRAKATHRTYEPNRRFVENRFAKQIFENKMLRRLVEENHLSWEVGLSGVKAVYRQLESSEAYRAYMEKTEVSYEDDNAIWRKIFTDMLVENEDFVNALEEMEIAMDAQGWTVDLDVIATYVLKTVKKFKEDSDADQPLLEMFDKQEEMDFALRLLQYALEGRDEYQGYIASHLKDWDEQRIPMMDKIILQVALAEILRMEDIAIEVSLNEYIEIAKWYSGDKSYVFINGILTRIMLDKHAEGVLPKAGKVK